MSASRLRDLAINALSEKRDRAAAVALGIRYEFAQVATEGSAVVPPPTAENIAMRVIEANSLVRAYDQSIALIDEIYRDMLAPDKGTSRTEKKKQEAPYQ